MEVRCLLTSVKGKADLIGNPALELTLRMVGWWLKVSRCRVSALRMPGEHNQQNLLMAVAAARLAGIEKDAITRHSQLSRCSPPRTRLHACRNRLH